MLKNTENKLLIYYKDKQILTFCFIHLSFSLKKKTHLLPFLLKPVLLVLHAAISINNRYNCCLFKNVHKCYQTVGIILQLFLVKSMF